MQTHKKYDCIVVGELNVDLILNQIDSFPEMGKEKIAEGMSLVLGSSSAILASNLSALGAKVGFVGKVGKDGFGKLIIDSLEQKGVITDNIIQAEGLKTGITVVMSFENDRANVTYPGAMNALTIDDISDDVLSQARHMHFSSVFLQPGIKKDLIPLFKKAKALGLTTSLDPQWDPQEKWDIDLNKLLQYVDFFFPNISELASITNKDTLESMLPSLSNEHHTIVKMGVEGAGHYTNGKLKKVPAFLNNEVVDTVGAGDSFNAGFLYQYLQGAPIDDCLEFASLTGAVSTTASGGTGAFNSYEQLVEVMKDKFNYQKSHEVTR